MPSMATVGLLLAPAFTTLIMGAPSPANDVRSPLDVINECFVVEVDDGRLGTGFLVEGGRVLTAAHVVGGQETVTLRSAGPNSTRQQAVVLLSDDRLDIAVLAPVSPGDATGLTIETAPFLGGSAAYAIGSPIGDLVLSQGTVVGPIDGLIETTTPVDPGNSGGPLVDSAGRVRGMIIATSQLTGHAYAQPATSLESVLERASGREGATPVTPLRETTRPSSGAWVVGVPLAIVVVLASIVLISLRRGRRPRITITVHDLDMPPETPLGSGAQWIYPSTGRTPR